MITRLSTISAAFAASSILVATAVSCASAAEVKLLCAVALKPAMDVLAPAFEKSSGHKLVIEYGTVGALAERMENGEAADVAIVSGPQNDALQAHRRIVSGSRADVAKVGVGGFVRKGAAKPDLSTVDAFKRAILGAKSITYPDPAGGGASGVYMAGLLDRLGIGGDVKSKTKLLPPGKLLYDSVADGDVEIGFNQISENLAATGIELTAPFPTSIQNYTVFAAGIGATAAHAEAGKDFIAFLSSPASLASLKAKGFE